MIFSTCMNESCIREIENGIAVIAPPHSNSFVDPVSGTVMLSAPFYYREVEGNFVFRAKVSLDFISTYDAGVLFAYDHDKLWAKACFEFTDIGTHAIVSVMTNQYSDDANCVNIEGNQVWLQLSRKDNVFAVHYSIDGENFLMARLTMLPMSKKIKVGVSAQSPLGQGGDRCFEFLLLEHRTLENIRAGK
jgi:uncharacterized protein